MPFSRGFSAGIDKCIYIGIDFGTTYSGVAWAWSGDPDNVHIVTNWSSNSNTLTHIPDNAKAPTEISYSNPHSVSWGYGIPIEDDRLKWFKLLLLDDADIQEGVRDSEYLKKTKASLRDNRYSKDPIDVVADYLKLLWQHTIQSMKRERGDMGVDGLPFKVVLTVPAIWKEYAKKRMRQAAEKAGILDSRPCGDTTLQLVSEPEAAALATLNEFKNETHFKPGDTFVVCDAGGGTVDIISYKIHEMNPLVLHESVEGKGKLCGAIFVDEKFKRMIQARIGPKKWEKLSRTSISKLMNDEWEHGIKRLFDEDPEKKWTVTLPPEAISRFSINGLNEKKKDGISIVSGRVQLTEGHIKGVFRDVLASIRALVNEQIVNIKVKEARKPKAIILVGGFGACNYLYQILSKEHKNDDIAVLQSRRDGPWTAICRGAVIRAGSNVVMSRVSRSHYGIAASQRFIKGEHDARDLYWCELESVYKARNQMTWYVNKGSNLLVQSPIRMDYYQLLTDSLPSNRLKFDIWQCDTADAPSRVTGKVHRLCNITCLIDYEFAELPIHPTTAGRMVRRLDYEVRMTSGEASLQFEVWVNGIKQGDSRVTVEIEQVSFVRE